MDSNSVVPQKKSYPLKSLWAVLGVILLVPLVGFGGIFAWIWSVERQGPYHNTSTVADLDGDGDLDIVTGIARYESQYTVWPGVTLWINQGEGKFSSTSLEAGFSPVPGDADADGDLDLVIVNVSQAMLLLNQAGAQGGQKCAFSAYGNPIYSGFNASGGSTGSIAVGDLDRDGDIDGFVSNCCGLIYPEGSSKFASRSWIWRNEWDPRGWLVRHVTNLPELDGLPVHDVALGDLNGDGSLDAFLAATLSETGQDSTPADRILLNDGQGNFRDSGQRLETSGSSSIVLGDLDGDHDLDALVGTSKDALVWLNQGGLQAGQGGNFTSSGQTIPSKETEAVFLSDLDVDGDLDALIAQKNQAAIWKNDGHGVFSSSPQPFRFTERHALAVGDFNNDKYPDIFAGQYAESYYLWINQGDGITYKKMSGPGKPAITFGLD